VSEAISDTGPILHLAEIGALSVLAIFRRVLVSNQVNEELQKHGIDLAVEGQLRPELTFETRVIGQDLVTGLLQELATFKLHRADASVIALADNLQIRSILTDDMELRKALESRGHKVIGTIGITVRAYKVGRLSREALENLIDDLFSHSSLHLSRGFRQFVREMLIALE
jgi:predicted nucleic acid-binding protein